MANKRIFYAVQQAGFSKLGLNTFTSVHGLQTLGITTKFQLEQAFEIGQNEIYQNIENIPDVEVNTNRDARSRRRWGGRRCRRFHTSLDARENGFRLDVRGQGGP